MVEMNECSYIRSSIIFPRSISDVVIGFEDTLYVVRGSENEVTLPVSVLEGRVRGDVVVRFRTRDGTATGESHSLPLRTEDIIYHFSLLPQLRLTM